MPASGRVERCDRPARPDHHRPRGQAMATRKSTSSRALKAKAARRAAKQRAACPVARLFPEQSALLAAHNAAILEESNAYSGIVSDRIELNESIARGVQTDSAWGAMWQV